MWVRAPSTSCSSRLLTESTCSQLVDCGSADLDTTIHSWTVRGPRRTFHRFRGIPPRLRACTPSRGYAPIRPRTFNWRWRDFSPAEKEWRTRKPYKALHPRPETGSAAHWMHRLLVSDRSSVSNERESYLITNVWSTRNDGGALGSRAGISIPMEARQFYRVPLQQPFAIPIPRNLLTSVFTREAILRLSQTSFLIWLTSSNDFLGLNRRRRMMRKILGEWNTRYWKEISQRRVSKVIRKNLTFLIKNWRATLWALIDSVLNIQK